MTRPRVTLRRAGLSALALAVLAWATACGGGSSVPTGLTVDDNGKLSELTKVTVTIPVKSTATVPWLLDEAFGEFKKRNIDLDVQVVKSSDAMVLLAKGEIDAIQTGMSAGLLNAIQGGSDLRAVMPSGFEPEDGKSGWYVSTASLNGRPFTVSMMKGQTFASSQGASGTTVLGLSELLATANLTLADVTVKTLSTPDIATALENGALFGGSVVLPYNVALEEKNAAFRVAPNSPDGYPSGIVLFGPSLMIDKPAVGKAVVSALLATFAHLQGDHVNDPTIGPLIAKALDQDWDTLKAAGPGKIWKLQPEFPDNYVVRYERTWRQIPGTLNYDGSLDPAKVLDTTYLDWALAQSG
jgi:NitT/TauT family transport system substrate-binding protein